MEDFLQFIAKKRQRLEAQRDRINQQLDELSIAEKIFLRSQETGSKDDKPRGQPVEDASGGGGRTIKERVVEILRLKPEGMTALDILHEIQKDVPSLTRTSLSPQLSRLKSDETLENDEESGLWRITAVQKKTLSPLDARRAIDMGDGDDAII